MKIIEIDALANGAHRNQDGAFETVPSGWAVIPDDMEIPDTFPFVNIETEEVEHTKKSMIPDGKPFKQIPPIGIIYRKKLLYHTHSQRLSKAARTGD